MEWYEQYFGKGTRKLTVYRDRKYRMFLVPDENIQLPPNHNCDAMGCGSVGPHIIGVYLPATKYDALKESHTKLMAVLEATRQFMQWGENISHLNCSNGYVPMMPHGDPEPCSWCILWNQIKQVLAEAQKL